VVLAEHNQSKELFAIKCVGKDLVVQNDDIECVMNERQILALHKRSPFFVELHSCFQTKVRGYDQLWYCVVTSLHRSICSLLWNLLVEEISCST